MTYLDYQATTPLAPEALAAMLPWLEAQHANPHSAHAAGRRAKAAVEVARDQILAGFVQPVYPPRDLTNVPARTSKVVNDIDEELVRRRDLAGPDTGRLIFTSGATEAINLAIAGTFRRIGRERPRIVTIATEHAAVLDTCDMLRRDGADVVILPVDRQGFVDRDAALAAIDERTALVAAMLVNNEIGTIQPIAWLGEQARRVGALMVCDAVQGFLRTQLPVWACDMVAVSAHKVHGPKGIGALWVRRGCEPDAMMHGGGQEAGIRSGTLSPALCAGFGAAVATFAAQGNGDVARLWNLAREILTGPEWVLNGDRITRYRGNINIRRDGLDVARLMSDLRDIAFSAGSACASGSGRPSHVLKAIGLTDAEARSSLRIGFGRYTAPDEFVGALERIAAAAHAQRIAA